MANKKKSFKITWKMVLALQIIASAVLFISVMKLGALPMLYLAIVAAILVLLNVLFALMMKPSKKRGKKNSLGKTFAKLLSVLMSVGLLLGCLYIEKGSSVLDMDE